MLNTLMARISLTAVALALSISANAIANPPAKIDIPAGELIEALRSLSTQSDIELVYQPEQVRVFRTDGVKGTYTPQQAIDILLKGTPLKVFATPSGAMVIAPPAPPVRQSGEVLHDPTPTASPESRAYVRLAQGDQRSATGQVGTQSGDAPTRIAIEEVIVTAQKRAERMQDVPVPVTALSAQALATNSEVLLKDYYSRVPGLNLRLMAHTSGQALSLRGISTGSGNPTVAILVDDLPYGPSTINGGGLTVPDFDPGDLDRIEVLRGPQGTLYGASSLGGLVKFVTVSPSTSGVSGRLQAGLNDVQNGTEQGYSARGSVNVPLSDSAAVRASAFTRRDPGYIDNVRTGDRAVNSADAFGGRVAGRWEFTPSSSATVTALYQKSNGDGIPVSGPFPGSMLRDLQQDFIPGVGGYEREVQSYSAVVSTNLDNAELTSLTGYSVNAFNNSYDYSAFVPTGATLFQRNNAKKFSQELRANVELNARTEWLIGGFYTHEKAYLDSDIFSTDLVSGVRGARIFDIDVDTLYEEYALFTDLTFKLSDRFDVQVGGRYGHNEQRLSQTTVTGAGATIVPKTPSDANAFTYLVTPRLRFSPELMIYARFASGYRPGGPNAFAGGVIPDASVPTQFDPDKTLNYELGAKGDLFGGIASFDISVYHIDWQDVQVVVSRNISYTINGGKARNTGAEISLDLRPTRHLTLSGWIALNNAELAEDFPSTATLRGFKGDPLPFSSDLSANVSVTQVFELTDRLACEVGAAWSYVGDRVGVLQGPGMSAAGASFPRQKFDSYEKLDFRVGVKSDAWSVDAYLNNVTDERGALSGGIGDVFSRTFYYIQPRTLGISVTRNF